MQQVKKNGGRWASWEPTKCAVRPIDPPAVRVLAKTPPVPCPVQKSFQAFCDALDHCRARRPSSRQVFAIHQPPRASKSRWRVEGSVDCPGLTALIAADCVRPWPAGISQYPIIATVGRLPCRYSSFPCDQRFWRERGSEVACHVWWAPARWFGIWCGTSE